MGCSGYSCPSHHPVTAGGGGTPLQLWAEGGWSCVSFSVCRDSNSDPSAARPGELSCLSRVRSASLGLRRSCSFQALVGFAPAAKSGLLPTFPLTFLFSSWSRRACTMATRCSARWFPAQRLACARSPSGGRGWSLTSMSVTCPACPGSAWPSTRWWRGRKRPGPPRRSPKKP